MSKYLPLLLLCAGLFLFMSAGFTPVAMAQVIETPTETPVETPTATPVPVVPTATPTVAPESPTATPAVIPTATPVPPTPTPVPPTPTPTATATPQVIEVGDISGDSVLNNDDVQQLLALFISGEALTPDRMRIADFNNDGKITPGDAQALFLFIKNRPGGQ